ncbi:MULTISPECIES: hypothetical protein [unclassified Pseudoxanthomonas]|uniref:hypothetical protein n=1 Tax=unclassified Pseudoxanthomonas TaxID=2645906 RepID=UPI00307FB1F4
MKLTSLLIGLFLSFLVMTEALACIEPEVPTFNQSLRDASSVFIFRITSISLTDKQKGARSLAGRIEVIDTLKGSPSFEYFAHQASNCGGLNLHVGRYYVVATSQSGKVLTLVRGDKSVLDMTADVLDSSPEPRGHFYTRKIREAIGGQPLATDVLQELSGPVYAFPPMPGE